MNANIRCKISANIDQFLTGDFKLSDSFYSTEQTNILLVFCADTRLYLDPP